MDWIITPDPVAYPDALAFMDARVETIRNGQASEAVWLLEHPHLYTAGTGADRRDLLDAQRFPVFKTGRGGQYTYHGPGQRVGYVMLDLEKRGRDVRAFVDGLENWLTATLARFDLVGERRAERVGLWVVGRDGQERKIAAIGVRVRKWVTFHGFSLNVCPNLDAYTGIVACGLPQYGVTSLKAEGVGASIADVDRVLQETFGTVFGDGI